MLGFSPQQPPLSSIRAHHAGLHWRQVPLRNTRPQSAYFGFFSRYASDRAVGPRLARCMHLGDRAQHWLNPNPENLPYFLGEL